MNTGKLFFSFIVKMRKLLALSHLKISEQKMKTYPSASIVANQC